MSLVRRVAPRRTSVPKISTDCARRGATGRPKARVTAASRGLLGSLGFYYHSLLPIELCVSGPQSARIVVHGWDLDCARARVIASIEAYASRPRAAHPRPGRARAQDGTAARYGNAVAPRGATRTVVAAARRSRDGGGGLCRSCNHFISFHPSPWDDCYLHVSAYVGRPATMTRSSNSTPTAKPSRVACAAR